MNESVVLLMKLMQAGRYKEALLEAQQLLEGDLPILEKASCFYALGCAINELGPKRDALPILLESLATFPSSETLLIAHVQDELARVQFDLNFYNSALFFLELAISNFDMGENLEMKASCEALRDEILRQV